jgi:hypothetical protein
MTTKQGISIFWGIVVLAAIIFLFYVFRGCFFKGTKPATSDTISVKIDTQWLKQDTFISYVPQPYKVNVPIPYYVHDSTIKYSVEKVDSLAILKDYLSTKYYKDVVTVPYGSVTINDTVTKNLISGRGVLSNINVPVVTKTVTIQAQQRNVVLFGVGLLGNKISPLYGAEATLDFKNKKDRIYEAGIVVLRGGDLYYKGSIKIPIRLHK